MRQGNFYGRSAGRTSAVGYSRLMGDDEEGTLGALRALRHSVIDPKIAEHRGRIVKTTGDGVALGDDDGADLA